MQDNYVVQTSLSSRLRVKDALIQLASTSAVAIWIHLESYTAGLSNTLKHMGPTETIERKAQISNNGDIAVCHSGAGVHHDGVLLSFAGTLAMYR